MRPGYKRTEVGEIPEDWVVASIGSMAALYQPTTISEKDFTECGYPVYGANGLVGYYSKWNHENWQVTVTCRGSTCGTVNRTVSKSWITGNSMVLNCDENDVVDKEFFYHLICGQDFSDCITGTGQPQIVRGPLAAFRLALPPTHDEQREIAKPLIETDALIESLEKLVAKKRAIKQGAMQSLLNGAKRLPGFTETWNDQRLGSLGSTYGGLTGVTKDDFAQGAARYVTFMNVMTNVIVDMRSLAPVRVRTPDAQTRVRKGDLLLNGSSETPGEVGLCALVPEDSPDVYLNSFCFGFRLNDSASANGLYLAHWFRSCEGRRRLWSLAQGAIRYNLSKTALLQVALPLPSPREQTAIAEVLVDLDADLDATTARLDKARAIKQGMMQELLTGRIRLV